MRGAQDAAFAAALAELLGFEAFPKYSEKRTDIIEALKLGGEKQLIAFCQGIQAGSPVDSFASPEPWDMPGYDSQVIMAAGAFTMCCLHRGFQRTLRCVSRMLYGPGRGLRSRRERRASCTRRSTCWTKGLAHI